MIYFFAKVFNNQNYLNLQHQNQLFFDAFAGIFIKNNTI